MKRRLFLKAFLIIPTLFSRLFAKNSRKVTSMVKKMSPIDFQWPTLEPFLFCVHHHDRYPAGNDNFGVDSKHFSGRQMGSDFVLKDGFRMYHGDEVPGFPVHPHRGFETITIVRKGYIDHADSMGAIGRYGQGDVQWMTAGGGVQHCEMFPLLNKQTENEVELFQIWLNLPKKNKMVDADFKMLWAEDIPKVETPEFEVNVISGEYEKTSYFKAPKNSWANDKSNSVTVLLVKFKKKGKFSYPAKSGTNRMIYFFTPDNKQINGIEVPGKQAVEADSNQTLEIVAEAGSELLILQAKPIGEPIVQYGPFVMNTNQEIQQAMQDYQTTQFGGWKWSEKGVIHGGKIERFAKYPNNKEERLKSS
jgi:redox-sensitive bicupin YhaK (pirin superfamily)